jgi:hypothetical protein
MILDILAWHTICSCLNDRRNDRGMFTWPGVKACVLAKWQHSQLQPWSQLPKLNFAYGGTTHTCQACQNQLPVAHVVLVLVKPLEYGLHQRLSASHAFLLCSTMVHILYETGQGSWTKGYWLSGVISLCAREQLVVTQSAAGIAALMSNC